MISADEARKWLDECGCGDCLTCECADTILALRAKVGAGEKLAEALGSMHQDSLPPYVLDALAAWEAVK